MAAIEISDAHDAKQIAERLIPEYHPHLKGVDILYLMTSAKPKRRGKAVVGQTLVMDPIRRYLENGESVDMGSEFLILIPEDIWDASNEAQRTALVDHQLAFIVEKPARKTDAEPSLRLRAPEIEEFGEIVQRHGLWSLEVRKFAEKAQQLRLFAIHGGKADPEPDGEGGSEPTAEAAPETSEPAAEGESAADLSPMETFPPQPIAAGMQR